MTTDAAEALDHEVDAFLQKGYRVESRTARQAVLVKGHRVNHLLHFFIGVLTLAVWWLLVWFPLILFGGEKRRLVAVDDAGQVTVKRA